MRYVALLAAAIVAAGGIGCSATNDDDRNAGPDTDTDIDTDTDSDTDTDTDSDSDSDTDADAGPTGDGGVIDMDCSACPAVGPTLQNMLCAVDICDDAYVVDNDYVAVDPTVSCNLEDTYQAVERFGSPTNHLAPKKNDSYALMASGYAEGTTHSQNLCMGTETLSDPWSTETTNIYDVMEWRLILRAPPEAKAVRLKYVFFSEEYDDFIAATVNDKFYVILEAGSTNYGSPTVINFTDCRDPTGYYDFICQAGDPGCEEGQPYCYIAINSALSECCWYPYGSSFAPNPGDPSCPDGTWTTDISGTGFECASDVSTDSSASGSSTGWLQTSWPIEGDEMFSLTFHIHDTGDGVWDSEVIIDAVEFLKDPDQGTVVIE